MVAGFRTRGQPAALAAVERAVASERPPGAMLLVGPPRVGKTTLALDLAAGLLCLAEDPAQRPCRACPACRKVDHDNHPDLHRLAPAGAGLQVGIGQVRELLVDLALLPLEGRFRIAIVEAAQRLNPDAQNALLKMLEEPPTGAVIVLCAADESLLLDTLRSRCRRVRLGPVDPRLTAELLVERSLADGARASRLARAAAGRPGMAVALAAAPEVDVVRARVARTLLDLTAADRRRRLASSAALLADAVALADAAEGPDPDRAEPAEPTPGGDAAPRNASPAERRRAAAALLDIWRDVARDLAVAAAGGRGEVVDMELLEEYEHAAADLDRAALAAFLVRLDGLAAAIEAYANPDLAVDSLLLVWPRAARVA